MYALLIALLMAFVPLAADNTEIVSLDKEEVFKGNYVVIADSIDLQGKVDGSAYLVGSSVSIQGDITGNVTILSGKVNILGSIQGNVTIMAAQINFEGVCGGDLFLISGSSDVKGKIEGKAKILSTNLDLLGFIQNGVQTFAGSLTIGDQAYIGGDLSYRSNNIAKIAPGATIVGKTSYHPSLLREMMNISWFKKLAIGSKVAATLMNFFYTFVVGMILIRMYPKKLAGTVAALHKSPWKAVLYGITLLCLFPLASLLLLVTVIGAPFALTLMALNIISFYTVKIFVILWIVNALTAPRGWKSNSIRNLLIGQIGYVLLVAIPYFGFLFSFVCMILGLGAMALPEARKALHM